MDFKALLAPLATVIVVILLPILLFFLYPRKPALPGPPLREYLPGGVLYSMFRDTRNTGDVIDKLRRTYGATFVIWLGMTRTVLTSVPQDVVHVVASSSEFVRPDNAREVFHEVAPGGIFTATGEVHRAARRSMRAQFGPSMLQTFHHDITSAATELCNSLSETVGKGPVDIWKFLAMNSIRIIVNVAFGTDMKKEERIKLNAEMNELAREMLKESVGFPIRRNLGIFGIRKNFLGCIASLRATCRDFIEKRLAESNKQRIARSRDVLDTIIEISGDDISRAIALAIEFAVAGSHTVNQLLTWTVYEVCCKPHIQKSMYNELDTVVGDRPISEPISFEDMQKLKYCMQVWKEALRLRPVGRVIMRKANQDVTLRGSGLHIPKGTAISAYYGYDHIDPQIWKDPLEFRPERWEEEGRSEGYRVPAGAYLPFGAGEYSCAGRFLADYEGPLVIAEMYRRFKFELACRPEEVKRRSQFVEIPQYVHGNVEEGVPIKVSLRGN